MYHKIIGGKKSKGQRNIKKVLNIYCERKTQNNRKT